MLDHPRSAIAGLRLILKFGFDPTYSFEDIAIFSERELTPNESVKVRHYRLASKNWTITWKRCKIGGKLLLITNRKSYMRFRLVPKSVTLNDLERRNSHNFA